MDFQHPLDSESHFSDKPFMGSAPKIENTDWSRWYLVTEKNRKGEALKRIKRYRTIGGTTKWERYPATKYRNFDEIEVARLLRQLNATYEIDKSNAEKRYDFHHAYVNKVSLGKFEAHIRKNSRLTEYSAHMITFLNKYVLDFFILQNSIPDPSRWHTKETEWGEWLRDRDLSPATIKKVVGIANRFTKFLVNRVYPTMSTPRTLEPIGRVVLADMQRKRVSKRDSRLIRPETFEKILKWTALHHPEVLPNIRLCYAFGLRISETQGLTKSKLLKDSLLVDEQGDRIENGELIRKTVKTKARRVPYWNMAPKEAWLLIQQIAVIHPDTLNKRVNKCLAKFGHTSHDFRRTFITNSLRTKHWKDVQRAVGHSDVRTTMGYDQDDTNLSEESAILD